MNNPKTGAYPALPEHPRQNAGEPEGYLRVLKATGERVIGFEPLADVQFNRDRWEEFPLYASPPPTEATPAEATVGEISDEQILSAAINAGINHRVIESRYCEQVGIELGTRHIASDVRPEQTIAAVRAILALRPAPIVQDAPARVNEASEGGTRIPRGEADYALMNQIMDLSCKAASASAKANSDDGHAGTEAMGQFIDLRREIWTLIANKQSEQATPPVKESAGSGEAVPASKDTVKRRARWLDKVRAVANDMNMPKALRHSMAQMAKEMEQGLEWGGTSHLRARIAELEAQFAAHAPAHVTGAAEPARSMQQVDEKVALKGGRWTSSDDVERMALEIFRAMYPGTTPPVRCLLTDVVGEAVKRLTAAAEPAAPAHEAQGHGGAEALREAVQTAQQNIGPRRPSGSSDPQSPDYDHDAFMWDYYGAALAGAAPAEAGSGQASTSEGAERIAVDVCRAVAELPDRNSPEDWPAAMLVTHEELSDILRAALATAPASDKGDYNELILAVSRKFPGETRHQTALRYIQQAESGADGSVSGSQGDANG